MTHNLKLTTVLILAAGLFACAPKDTIINETDLTATEIAEIENLQLESPQKYIDLAAATTGVERNQHLFEAAHILHQLRQHSMAEKQLSEINNTLLNRQETIDIQFLMAEIKLGQKQPRESLRLLSTSSILPPAQQMKLLRLRARAFLDAGYPLESAKTRVQMDKNLTDSFDQDLNHQAIWEALSLLPKTSLEQASKAPLNPQLLGWVELAKIAKRGQIDWLNMQDGIYNWRKRYPKHPAAKVFISELGSKQIELIEQPKHIAVLLPLNGKYASVAAAIRDGIMSAYYQHPDKSFQPEISFIDTSNNQAAISLYYKKAIDSGADFVIGPFLKSAVDILSRSPQMEAPTLTLNYASAQSAEDTENETISNLFQFGLLPEDEAHQSAEMAFRQGRTHAAVLVPEGNWGERLRDSFKQRFEELGGQVISAQTYVPNKNNFKQPIQNMLNINQSYTRYRSVKNIMRTSMKFTPYRRQDVDMIFMAATPKDARQLKPQFKFHYAGEIPVYSTSHAFTGQLKKRADRDIDDLNFIDMPWILNPPNRQKQSLINYWPEQQRFTRFFALGVDAYNLIPFLGRLQGKSYERFSGQTGNLYLDSDNRIHRELLWAQFNRGVPTLIDISTLPLNFSSDEVQPIN